MIFDNQLRLAEEIIKSYSFSEPFHLYLKKYFRANKKFGSKDRRLLSSLCYNYYRLGNILEDLSLSSQIIVSSFIIEKELTPFLEHHLTSATFKEIPDITAPIADKLAAFSVKPNDLFKFKAELSEEIDREAFALSHLQQPDVWIRVNRGFEEALEQVLTENEVAFEKHPEATQAYKVPAKTNLEHILKGKNVLYEVQDLSSQLVGELFTESGELWWDCCAGAGGKSLLLKDKLPKADLYVSDVRKSILENLAQRFKANKLYSYKFLDINLANLTTDLIVFDPDKKYVHTNHFDNIIVDAPCSGSGTWGRAPENLNFFNETLIAGYQEKQKAIAANAMRFLKSGGSMYYITCSVFKAENEEVVNYLTDTFNVTVQQQLTVKGYEQRCDSMFAVKLVKD